MSSCYEEKLRFIVIFRGTFFIGLRKARSKTELASGAPEFGGERHAILVSHLYSGDRIRYR